MLLKDEKNVGRRSVRKLAFLLATVSACLHVSAQYAMAGVPGSFYTDIVPDTFLNPVLGSGSSAELIDLDLNQDATVDVRVRASVGISPGGTSIHIYVSALNSSTALVYGNTDSLFHNYFNSWYTWTMLQRYDSGDTIQAGTFVNGGELAYTYNQAGSSKSNTSWVNAGDRFVGVRYIAGSNILYGWIKVNVTSTNTVYVKEHSLGNYVVGVRQYEVPEILFYPNPATNTIHLPSDIISVRIYDSLGNSVLTRQDVTEVDVGELPDGVYFARVRTVSGTSTRKLIIRR